MPLLTVILVCLLLSPSNEIAITGILLALAAPMCVVFVISGTKVVEEKIGKRRLVWPKDALKRGTLYWGLAVIVFVAQLSTIVYDFGFPSIYESLLWGGLTLCGIAGFESYRTFRFIFNPQYQPKIDLSWILMGLVLAVADVMSIILLRLLYPTFETISVVGKIFTALLIPSIVASILFLWGKWTGKNPLLVKVAYLLVVIPYLFLIALFVIIYVVYMLAII
jgi:hypothetical protein